MTAGDVSHICLKEPPDSLPINSVTQTNNPAQMHYCESIVYFVTTSFPKFEIVMMDT